ncbi:MAG TPA: mechanosensitive ion channel domain-containing protein, partial [Candidatus Krumholzibacteria bacterium]
YSPAQRAEAAEERLRDVVRAHPRNDQAVSVDVAPHEMGTIFQVDGRMVFGVVAGDVDRLTGETYDQLIARTRTNLQEAVAAALEQRTTSRLIRSIVLSVIATVLLIVALRALVALLRWTGRLLHTRVLGRSKPITDTHVPMFRQLGTMVRGALRTVGVIIGLVLIDVWLTFVLKQFPYTYPWGDQIDDFLIRVTSGIGLAILRAVPNLVIVAIIVLIGRFVERWIKLFFDAVKEGRIDPPGVDADTAIPVRRLVVLFLWVVVIAIAYPFIPGSQGVAFKGLSVLLGVMLSLGSSNVVSQAASGYMIMFSRAFRPNDYVRIGEYEGTIMSVGMLSTKLRTPRDEEINVPNAVVVGTTIKNYTRLNKETGAPVTTTVTIGYNAPWRQVHAMLLGAAAETPGLRTDPAPRVLQTALSDFYVEYTLFARLEVPQSRATVLSELHANIQDTFNVNGVQIMSPHYEGDPDDKVWVPRDKWYDAPAERPDAGPTGKSKGTA